LLFLQILNMRNIFLIAGFAAVVLVSCNENQSQTGDGLPAGPVKITGKIAGMDDGLLEFLYPVGDSSKTDTVQVKGGKFTYNTELSEPINMIFRIAGSRGEEVAFFADPGKMSINGFKDSMWTSKVTGGPTQTQFLKVDETIRAIMKPAEGLMAAYGAAQESQNMNEVIRIQEDYQKLQDSAMRFARNFVLTNKNSVLSAYYALVYLNQPGEEAFMQEVFENLTPAVQKSFFGEKLGEFVASVVKTNVGSEAPDFTQNDAKGNPVSLSSFRGKYVLVDFWASWCQPCRVENPNIVKAYNTFKSKGFDILGVSLDRDEAAWKKAIVDDKLTWTHVSDLKFWENEAAQLYGIRSIPASFLLDPEGKIIAKDLRGEALEAKLREVLP
jgi:peroxiredoxin